MPRSEPTKTASAAAAPPKSSFEAGPAVIVPASILASTGQRDRDDLPATRPSMQREGDREGWRMPVDDPRRRAKAPQADGLNGKSAQPGLKPAPRKRHPSAAGCPCPYHPAI